MMRFMRFARVCSQLAGRSATFIAALAAIVAWALLGPVFGYSDAWQLTINTGTTIVTFLMVFLIQATQNRDTEELQIKLDELIRSIKGADNELLGLEKMEEEELLRLRERYTRLAERAHREMGGRRSPRRAHGRNPDGNGKRKKAA